MEIITSLVAAIVSLLAGSLLQGIERFFRKRREPAAVESFSEKLSTLSDSLARSSREVDVVLAELTQVAQEREAAVARLEEELRGLEDRERQLQDRIQALESVPLPVAEHFAQLAESGERRSAMRDYILFGAGVVVSTIIAILLELADLGGKGP